MIATAYMHSWLAAAVGGLLSYMIILVHNIWMHDEGARKSAFLRMVAIKTITSVVNAYCIFLSVWNCYSQEYTMRRLFYNRMSQQAVCGTIYNPHRRKRSSISIFSTVSQKA